MASRGTLERTDWDRYYESVPATAHLSRRYTSSVLLGLIDRFLPVRPGRRAEIVEFGGANSCFLQQILDHVHPAVYTVVDTNEYGLSLLAGKFSQETPVRLKHANVLDEPIACEADLVFSIGLVEHFDTEGTRKAVVSHFEALRSGGLAIISFPTPTILYRTARRSLEAARMWQFPDERPLLSSEVSGIAREHGEIVFAKTLWPLVLTQHILAVRKA
jgi:hypothetical protein